MNTLRVLYFGDIVGRPGRVAVTRALTDFRQEFSPDLVLGNIENLAHGFGITESTINEMSAAGIDIFTSGNHIFDNDMGVEFLRSKKPWNVLRPANYHESTPGVEYAHHTVKGTSILVINLLGQTFMPEEVASPFTTFDRLYEMFGTNSITLVDLHAEATGEKYAMGYYIDGKASLLVGTHTHIQTSDEHIFEHGLGYISDIGFSGAKHSSLGMDPERVLQKVAYNQPVHLQPPTQADIVVARAVVVDIDTTSKKTVKIARVDRTYRV